MKQITEDYVSYEIAKLLKEKGFKEITQGYINADQEVYMCPFQLGVYELGDKQFPYPTHQMALKWLREVHNIHISVQPDYPTKTNYQLSWCWSVNMLHKDCFECKKHQSYIDTFEQAVEAAILYVLKNLI